MLLADEGRRRGAEPGQGWSLSCSNIAGMFSLGPCQVFGRGQAIQLGAVRAAGFSGERWCKKCRDRKIDPTSHVLRCSAQTEIQKWLALIRTPKTAAC